MRALALLALACLLASCTPAAAPNPALWRIADADSEIWLFGTVHVLPPGLRWRSERVNAAFAAADELVTETDLGPADRFQELAARHGGLPEGETLSGRLSAEDAERLARVARDLGVNPASLQRQRPWLTALQLYATSLLRSGKSPDAGVESVLAAEAQAAGKQLTFLESPEQQVRILADLPPDEEARFLSLTLREIEDGAETAEAMDAAWASGDLAALEQMLDAQWREAGPVFHAALIVNRNQAWAREIERRLDGSGRIFVAVGAAHLVGDESVVALLRGRGVVVEGP
jgi:uncharacterized protein YbaP (TraB family)